MPEVIRIENFETKAEPQILPFTYPEDLRLEINYMEEQKSDSEVSSEHDREMTYDGERREYITQDDFQQFQHNVLNHGNFYSN